MGLSFDILIFDCLLKAPQPVTGLFFIVRDVRDGSNYIVNHNSNSLNCEIL